jgi:hypothetical protein
MKSIKIIKVKEWLRLKKLNDAWITLCLLSPKATYENKKKVADKVKEIIRNGGDLSAFEHNVYFKLEIFKKKNLSPDESRVKPEFNLI